MKITKVSYSRKHNLGNYETLDLAIEAELSEQDNPLTAWASLADQEASFFAGKSRQVPQPVTVAPPKVTQEARTAPAPSTPRPPVPTRLPDTKDPEVCPKCGGRKAAAYDLCYNCHMDQRGQQ